MLRFISLHVLFLAGAAGFCPALPREAGATCRVGVPQKSFPPTKQQIVCQQEQSTPSPSMQNILSTPAMPAKPQSVNFHLTRECNYACKFCFHTAKTSFVLSLDEAKEGIRLLQAAGMEKINFSGGEPFLPDLGWFVGELCKYAKDLGVDSVSIISNGSKITEEWMKLYSAYLDILGVSCDSQVQKTLYRMGRAQGKNDHITCLRNVREWCNTYGVGFKINTVVTSLNYQEDMSELIRELAPIRWKVFQCLTIEGENSGEGALRQASALSVSAEQFLSFVNRHASVECLVPEDNRAMRDSYLILDERTRFLDNTQGKKKPSSSILDVGVARALAQSGFDENMFVTRGGRYNWSKKDFIMKSDHCHEEI